MTILISEIHRTSGQDVGFLEGDAADGRKVYMHFKYGYLSIYAGETMDEILTDFDETKTLIFESKTAHGGYHITDQELVEATKNSHIRWPQGFGGNP